jgi:hypothetical protein
MRLKDQALGELDRLLNDSKRILGSFQQTGARGEYDPRSSLPEPELWKFYSGCIAAVDRYAGRDSSYGHLLPTPSSPHLKVYGEILEQLVGIVMAVREAVDRDLLGEIERTVRSNTYEDFLTQAEELLNAKPPYHVAAMVLVGGVLEDHLLKMCTTRNLPWKGRDGMSAYNDSLKEVAYPQMTWRRIQAVADQRNAAAHGGPDASALKTEDVIENLAWTRKFIEENP